MKKSIVLLLAAYFAPEGRASHELEPLKLSIGKASDGCQNLLEQAAWSLPPSEELRLPLQSFILNAENPLLFRNCDLFWQPDLPQGKRIAGGTLTIEGDWQGPDTASARLRLGHRLLGLGIDTEIQTFELKKGPFRVSLPIQNEAKDACDQSARLHSSLSFLLRFPRERAENGATEARLALKSLHIDKIFFVSCPLVRK